MTTQTEAERLADWLERRQMMMLQDRQAAAELRRQQAEIERLNKALAAKDEFKAAYIEAMVASNEAGFAGMSAAETIHELSRMVAEQPAQTDPVIGATVSMDVSKGDEPEHRIFGRIYEVQEDAQDGVTYLAIEEGRNFDTPQAQPAQQEPVGVVNVTTTGMRRSYVFTAMKRLPDGITDLYTSPQPAPVQEPMTFGRLSRGMEILAWNRAQAKPPIEISKEQWVADELERFYAPQAQPAREPIPYNKNDMEGLDVNQRLGFKLGWKSAEAAHGIGAKGGAA